MRRFRIVVACILVMAAYSVFLLNFTTILEKIPDHHMWLTTTAKVTYVQLPMGNVYGNFEDYMGNTHEGIFLFQTPRDTEFQPGDEVKIRYYLHVTDCYNMDGKIIGESFHTMKIEKYKNLFVSMIPSSVFLLCSIILLLFSLRKPVQLSDKHTK